MSAGLDTSIVTPGSTTVVPDEGAQEIAVSWDDCVRYGRSVRDWPAFPDTAGALIWIRRHRSRLDSLGSVSERWLADERATSHNDPQ
jgi:hypothetical protein